MCRCGDGLAWMEHSSGDALQGCLDVEGAVASSRGDANEREVGSSKDLVDEFIAFYPVGALVAAVVQLDGKARSHR
ncbi:MAG: hypothetical protein PHQ40_21070, partial [Anaerolineaceae bacterium]|nr:hypothetical protein [Anaerolineaceae bacterium]